LTFHFRLIDGLTGEKSVYKKRGEQEPEVGAPQVLYTLHQASVANPDIIIIMKIIIKIYCHTT
jgi:hypothetical protein